jgi:lipopolysaccharide transport system permease protein
MIHSEAVKSELEVPVIRIEAKTSAALDLGELWEYRELLYFLIWRDVKVRYKQTAIGAAWAIVQPLLTMLVFTVVFGRFANMPSNGLPYPIFSYAALLPWTFFAKGLSQSVTSVVNDANLITKVYFPRLLLPLSAVLSGIIDFAISFLSLLVLMGWYGIVPAQSIIFLPYYVLLCILTALAVGLWLGVINVRYRDVGQAIPFVVQIWMFASPVAYPLSVIPEKWRFIYNLNPMSGVIEGFRWALFGTGILPFESFVLSTTIVAILLWGGIRFFNRMEETFADVV